ncbi:hypothetical protein BgiMline_014318 [Biomphalaria glabrata]|nr:hypothetical protein BgiMline_013082 [Biomphalaria glabrata]KAI8773246.1 hypothetical protein BgiBS90_025664 [Biomphalaria glabrata]
MPQCALTNFKAEREMISTPLFQCSRLCPAIVTKSVPASPPTITASSASDVAAWPMPVLHERGRQSGAAPCHWKQRLTGKVFVPVIVNWRL